MSAPAVANGAAETEANLKMIEVIADDFEGGINFVQVSEEELQYASAGDAHQAQAVQELRGAVSRIRAALDSAQQAAPKAALTDSDTKRLDFMIEKDAFIVKVADKSTFLGYQLMAQNEDEEYIELSGECEVFRTERAAIDMAMLIAAVGI